MRVRAPFLACLIVLGCLPEAAPPVGRRLVDERDLDEVVLAPSPSNHVAFVRHVTLTSGEFGVARRVDLAVVRRDGGGERALGSLLVQSASPRWDAAGGLYLDSVIPSGGRAGRGDAVLRFDAATGEQLDFGPVEERALSPEGRRFYRLSFDGLASVRELDGREQALGPAAAGFARFLGEDLFFHNGTSLVMLPAADAGLTFLLPAVRHWWPVNEPGDPEALIIATSDDPRGGTDITVVGPHGRPTASPPVVSAAILGRPIASSDGARVAVLEPGADGRVHLRVVRVEDGSEVTADLEIPAPERTGAPNPPGVAALPLQAELVFRPRGGDLLCFLNGRARLLRADGSLLLLDDRLEPPLALDLGGRFFLPRLQPDSFGPSPASDRLFTHDGRRWLYQDRGGTVFLGDADDPAAAGLPLSRAQELAWLSEPTPGQLLLWIAPGGNRVDVYALDLATQQRRMLAKEVSVVVPGQRRLLAGVRAQGREGLVHADLALIDLFTGAEQVLARNVTDFAAAPVCPACDPTAAGVPVAFVVNARVPFEYDGLWTTELP